MSLLLHYFKIYLLDSFRNRAAFFFTIIFPTLLLVFFGRTDIGTSFVDRLGALAVYANYAAQSVALMSFGIAISEERSSCWMQYLKTLPVKPIVFFSGRMMAMFVIAVISIILLLMVSYFSFVIHFSFYQYLWIFFIAMVGVIPMALLAIAIGNLINPTAARNIFIILNLSFLCATFISTTSTLGLELLSMVPSYQWLMLSISPYTQASESSAWFSMFIWTVLFYFFAKYAYNKKRNLRMR